MGWSFEPAQLVPIVVVALLYARRALTLARRDRPVPPAKLAAFGAGLAVSVGLFRWLQDLTGLEMSLKPGGLALILALTVAMSGSSRCTCSSTC